MTPQKTALITGYTGQDGTFLTKHLLEQGYRVVGLVRRISTEPPRRVRGKFDFSEALANGSLILADGDLGSITSLIRIIKEHDIQEIYNLAWQSHVGLSFKIPEVSIQDYQGFVNLITAVEQVDPRIRVYQASTSEMFGDYYKEDPDVSMTEHTPLRPNSPYAIAKTAAHHFAQMKREQGLYIACGILFNHESEIRGGDFVTQKIARGVARIPDDLSFLKPHHVIELGNLDAMRDWGYAGDYVKAMALMLQQETPEDYVVGTGTSHSVRDFVTAAFRARGHELSWHNISGGSDEYATIADRVVVSVNPEFYRPNDVNFLNGDSSKIQGLGWEMEHDFESLVEIMVNAAREELL